MNIFRIIQEIGKEVTGSTSIQTPDVLNNLYKSYLSPMIRILKNYCNSINLEYFKVIILADSLDRTWDSKSDLAVQSELIVALLEIVDSIGKLLADDHRGIEVQQIVFLRRDIFDYILKNVSEPDKLWSMSHEINWEDYPHLLKRVVEDRFKHILNLKTDREVGKAWVEFFEIKGKAHPFEVIEGIVTRRPRDVIYFLSRLFESAINKGHSRVNHEDLKYAIESYTTFLNNNLIAETKAEYPEIAEILAKLQEHHGRKLEYSKFTKILRRFGYDQRREDELVQTLFEKDYMLGFDIKKDKPFSDLDTLRRKLGERRFFLFPNKVYVIAHAKYYFIRNKPITSF